jgi:dCTP deaminase
MVDRSVFVGAWGTVTYGLGPAGYDVTADVPGQITLWPGNFRLIATVERFDMPDDLVGYVHDKSSWARRGLTVQNTVIEPGWRGYLTLELTHHGETPLVIDHGVGIAQIVFHELDRPTERPYEGKYQDQEQGPQGAR